MNRLNISIFPKKLKLKIGGKTRIAGTLNSCMSPEVNPLHFYTPNLVISLIYTLYQGYIYVSDCVYSWNFNVILLIYVILYALCSLHEP